MRVENPNSLINEKEFIILKFDKSILSPISNVKLVAPPNSTVRISLTSIAIKNLSDLNYSFSLIIHLRPCFIGEILFNDICVPCQNGYSFFPSLDKACKSCKEGMNCSDLGVVTINTRILARR